jgi:hypothetical protein
MSYINGNISFIGMYEGPGVGVHQNEFIITDVVKNTGATIDFKTTSNGGYVPNGTVWSNFNISDNSQNEFSIYTAGFGGFTGTLYSDSTEVFSEFVSERTVIYNGYFVGGTLFTTGNFSPTIANLTLFFSEGTVYIDMATSGQAYVAPAPANSAPTDIQLSSVYINESSPVGTVVGTLSTTDPDASDNFTYSLVGGTGSTDNTSFEISGNLLIAKESFVHATKSSYAIRIRSTDQDNATYEEEFTIQVQEVAPSNVVVTNNQIPQQIVDLSSGSSFTFTDPITPSLTQSVKIFSGVGYLPLADLSSNGLTVAIKNSVSTVKYIYAPVDPADLSITDPQKLPMIFKVLDLSGNIQSSVNIPIEVYTDSNLGNVVQYDVSGTIASTSGVLVGPVGNKFKYTLTITRGDGQGTHTFSTATPSSGSDPHITTIFGKKYDFHPSTRRNYTLFKSQDMKVSSHFTGLKSGVYYDKVMIDLPNKQQVKVDFHSKQIKGKSSFVSLSEESLPIQYKNHTSDKSVGKIFEPKKMTKLSVAGKHPVDLFVDFNTRYVHFRFPNTLPVPSEMSGLIVEPATRLD